MQIKLRRTPFDEKIAEEPRTEGTQTTTTVTAYNANGSVSSESVTISNGGDSKTETTTYEYDNMNRVISQTTTADGKRRPETTTYAYGTIARNPVLGDTETVYALITTTISGSTAAKSFTDPSGNVIREDAGGVSTYYAYDRSGNRISQASVGQDEDMSKAVITAAVYDQRGNQTHALTDVVYDRETGTYQIGENTVTISTEYDAQSRAVKTVDGRGTITTMAYDTEGQMKSITQNAGGDAVTTTVDYVKPSAASNTSETTVTAANGTKSKTIVNVQGQTIREATIGSGSDGTIGKDYAYSAAGNVTRVTDTAGNYRAYEYDALDRKTAVNYFDQNGRQTLRTEYVYDTAGNMTEMKDYTCENGTKTLYRWTENRYDGLGNLTSEAEVDCQGTAPSEAQLAAKRILYTYDDEDRLIRTDYPSGFDSGVSALEYEYGDYSRLIEIKAVTSAGTKALRTYTYGSKGQVISIKDDRSALGGTGYTLKSYAYDRLERPVSLTVTDSEKEGTAEQYTYAYDVNNQIVTETRLNNYPAEGTGKVDETWNYVYDNLGRLLTTTVTDNGSGEAKSQKAYTYDKAGNRLTETEDDVTTTNTYNSLNQMVASGGSSYTYDANGNQIKETDGSTVKTFAYDADNRLASASFTENGSQTLLQENTYNGEGQRIAKTEQRAGGTETTRYTYQSGSVIYTDGSEGRKTFNIQGDSDNIIAAERDTATGKACYFYNKDMRASTTSILDESGVCQAAYEYTDFGATTASSDFYNEICYTGGIYDASTGLYYLNARYYDPADGRFLTEDTYRGSANTPSSLHLYAYCANNPVNYVDPSGHRRKMIGYGAQVDFSIGTGYTQANGGFDIIYLNKCVKRYGKHPVHIYYHYGGSNNFADAEKAAERLLATPSKILSKDTLKSVIKGVRKGFAAAAVFFMLYADTKKINTYAKVAGRSYNGTISVNHVLFTLGLYSGGISVGTGFTTSKKFSFSTGPTVMKFNKDWTNDFRNISSSTLTKIKLKANKSYQKAITRKFDILSAR